MEFGCDECFSEGAFVANVCDLVPANGELSAMRFILLGTIVATDPTISCMFVLGHLLFANEKTSVSAFDVLYSLKQATEFVCKAVFVLGHQANLKKSLESKELAT